MVDIQRIGCSLRGTSHSEIRCDQILSSPIVIILSFSPHKLPVRRQGVISVTARHTYEALLKQVIGFLSFRRNTERRME